MALPPLPQLILNDNFEEPITTQLGGYYEVNGYRIGDMLGAGTFGVVRKALHLQTQTFYAAKILFLPTIERQERLEMIEEEARIIKITRHPNIIRLVDSFLDEADDKYYLIFELCSGGELYDRIVEAHRFTEKSAGVILATILAAVAFLHAPPHPIIHRDIKLENILFRNDTANSPLVIVDFGVAMLLEESTGRQMTEIVGSRPNMAPELIRSEPYDSKVDLWAIGIIAYTLLSGQHPFQMAMESPDQKILSDSIISGNVGFGELAWTRISPEAKAFVSWLLKLDPKERPTAQEALDESIWLRNCCPPGYLDFLELVNVEYLRRQYEALNEKPPESLLSMAEIKRRRDSLPNWTLTSIRRKTLRTPRELFGIERVRTLPVGEPSPSTTLAQSFVRELAAARAAILQTPETPVGEPPLTILPASDGSTGNIVLSPASDSAASWGTPIMLPMGEDTSIPETTISEAVGPASPPESVFAYPDQTSEDVEIVSSAHFEQVPLLKIADMVDVVPALTPSLPLLLDEAGTRSSDFSPVTLSPTVSLASFALDSPPPMVSTATPNAALSRQPSQGGLVPWDLDRTWPIPRRTETDSTIKRGRTVSGAPLSPSPSEILGYVTSFETDVQADSEDPEERAQFEAWMASMQRVRDATLRRKMGPGSPSSSMSGGSFANSSPRLHTSPPLLAQSSPLPRQSSSA